MTANDDHRPGPASIKATATVCSYLDSNTVVPVTSAHCSTAAANRRDVAVSFVRPWQHPRCARGRPGPPVAREALAHRAASDRFPAEHVAEASEVELSVAISSSRAFHAPSVRNGEPFYGARQPGGRAGDVTLPAVGEASQIVSINPTARIALTVSPVRRRRAGPRGLIAGPTQRPPS